MTKATFGWPFSFPLPLPHRDINVTALTTKDKLLSRFGRKTRIGLRSPARTIKALRWALETNRPTAYMLVLGWGYLLSTVILGYILFAVPPRPDVGPTLDKTAKAIAALYPCMQFLTMWLQTQRAWRRRERRMRRRSLADTPRINQV